jgi:UDP-glucose 4-epimerase
MPNVLLTGGLGYIGSHILVELIHSTIDYSIFIIDNLSNSSIDKWLKLQEYCQNKKPMRFYCIDLIDKPEIDKIFHENSMDMVIHLAGLKSVGESIKSPLYYYQTNLISTMNLLEIMQKYQCKNIIFSSSATVYGEGTTVPYQENMPTGIGLTNPYGKTKQMQEEILRDVYRSDSTWNIILLRYFNPISQKHDFLKENPNGIPNNLFPYVLKVHERQIEQLCVFGKDYDTPDGTCIRDFIHVVDLANGHIHACEKIWNSKENPIGLCTYNLGTGNGISVQELIHAFEQRNNVKLNYVFSERRPGDLAVSYANVELARKELGWSSQYSVEEMVQIV